MKILVAYATTDGQTRKVARFAADRLADAGQAVELLNLTDTEGLELPRFGAVILAGSLHAGGFQAALADFARAHAPALNATASLFLAVSLSAAGDDPDDWEGLERCLTRFLHETGWQPGQIEHVAGAFRFTEYDFFRAWAMRHIAQAKGETVDPHGNKEYTDWYALGVTLDTWLRAASGVSANRDASLPPG